MRKKILKIAIIALLIVTIMMTNFLVLATNLVSYAFSEANQQNVEFNSYFELEDGNRTNEIEKAIFSNDINLCMEIEVKQEGYLNGKIELRNANFKLKVQENENIETMTDNTITLKQINAGQKVKIQVGLEVNLGETIELASFNQENTVTLTGTYQNAMQKEAQLEKESKIKVIVSNPNPAYLDTQIITNKIYEINGENKRIIQVAINSGLEGEGYPIKQTNLQLEVPEIPEKIEVLDRGTQATKENSMQYQAKDNQLAIQINNQEEEGKVNYGRQKKDTLIVSFVYQEQVQLQEQAIQIKDQIELYDQQGTRLEKETTNLIREEKDGIIGYQIRSNENLYKGKMYANEVEEYESTTEIDIRYSQSKQNILVKEGEANYKAENETGVQTVEAEVVYKNSVIDAKQLQEVLGEQGELIIKKPDGTQIAKLNQENIKTESEEPLTVHYEENQKEIIIEVNHAENTGRIVIKNKKEIRQNSMTKEEFRPFNQLLIKGKEEEKEQISIINLQEPQTKVETEINNNKLLGGKINQSVEIKTTLLTNSNAYDLYKEPKIEVEFPKEIKKVDINNVNLLYGNELTKQTEEVYETEDGRQAIRIQLAGEQTQHMQTQLAKGANVILNCNLEVEDITENKEDAIQVKYTNKEATQYDKEGVSELAINYLAEPTKKAEVQEEEESAEPEAQSEPEEQITITKNISAGEGNDIYEKQVQKYTITIKNNTDHDISNVLIEDEIPKEVTYATLIYREGFGNRYQEEEGTTQYSETIETLKAKEEIEKTYYVRVKQAEEIRGKTIGTKAKAIVEENIYESNLVQNTIRESKLQVDMVTSLNSVETYFLEGSNITYKIVVKNITNEELTGVTVTNTLPEGTSFMQAADMLYNEEGQFYYMNRTEEAKPANYKEASKKVTWEMGDLKAGEEKAVYLIIKLGKVQEDKRVTIGNKVEVTADNMKTAYSNIEEIEQGGAATCKVEMETNLTEPYLYEGNEFEYLVTVTNTSDSRVLEGTLTDELPSGLILKEIRYTVEGEEYQVESSMVNVNIKLKPQESTKIKILVEADVLPEGYEEIEIRNKAVLTDLETNDIASNEIVNKIRKKVNSDDNPNDNPDDNDSSEDPTQGNSITGIAWVDQNQNGVMEENEDKLVGIKVELYKDNEMIMTTSTKENGVYTLSHIPNGKYMVVFHYDTTNYSLTEYKKSGVNEQYNSDVIKTNLEGQTVAVTDELLIENSNLKNINLGLIQSNGFNLKLDKCISNITVQNGKGSKKYEYHDANFTKVELDRKTIANTTVTITYKIKVTNEGGVAGYAKQIVDYLPSDFKFNAQLNKGWQLKDGKLVNTSLANEVMYTNETRTLDLIVTKNMTENNLGTVTNTAEITEDYNKNSITDTNIADNKSTASVIIGLNTGKMIMYISFTITIIAILGVGIYFINKKVLKP